MYRTAELTQSWGLRQPKWTRPSPRTMAAARWPWHCRTPVCGIFVRRYGNGSDPDPEGPIRFLIEREGESSAVTCNERANTQCSLRPLPRRCRDRLRSAGTSSCRYSRQDPGEQIDFPRLSKGIATILVG